jgi:hypothetical protein
MRSARRLILVCLLLLAPIASARAFVRQVWQHNQTVYHPLWHGSLVPVQFVLNDRKLELLLNFAPGSELVPAVERALRPWSIAPNAGSVLRGTTSVTDPAADGVNLITFADTPRTRDVTTGATALTTTWMVLEGGRAFIAESDIILNPKEKFATDGRAEAADLQNILVHEAGHAFGLGHSGIASATMFPYTRYGETVKRVLDSDDIAGIRSMYEPSPDLSTGAIAGTVVTDAGAPVFGAHVVAVAQAGSVHVGAVTERDGAFRLPYLPPGEYQVYAEPLDGPVRPANLDRFWSETPPALVEFRTAFVGGNASPSSIRVSRRRTVALDPIRVELKKAAVNPRLVSWSTEERFLEFWNTSVPLAPGATGILAVGGEGLEGVPASGFRVSGDDVTIDTNAVYRAKGPFDLPWVYLPLSVRAGAVPGARTLFVAGETERVAYSGVVRIVTP